MLKHISRLVIGLLTVALLGGCSMTHLKTSWKAPDVRDLHFRKVVAFVVSKDKILRRNGEHQLCERITNVLCVPAYAIVADEDRGNIQKVTQRVDDASFDGAVVLRYAGRRTEEIYVPPTPAPLWGYYGYGWGTAYNPGYVRQNELVDIETAVYSVKDRKLLWLGTTESLDPGDVRSTVDEIAEAVAAQMRKEGLIPAGRRAAATY